ncbi:DUF885 domain-containing protein [Sphingomonas sp. RP10(2022)]|uniref:DUF885 domain-containing protein n=1 Tax=Sphingomonas liriopis TaxID=2949094 RepID=A0A9X2HZ90_9SPHN|nr:DUF885 family protein [Sphingomonas liriopis]MCP3735560.1 DUF885 domain-containing protein [Sphingomonas liriopis]
MIAASTRSLAQGVPADALRIALDEAQQLPPGEALASLAGFDPATLAPPRRLDLVTARAGLAIDAQLATLPNTRGRSGGYRPIDPAARIAPGHYALLLRRPLGDVTPQAAQARLTRELARLHARAAQAFAAIGMTEGSIGERYTRLWRDERFLYPDADAAVADMAALLAAARSRVAATIGPVPGWCTNVTVRGLSPAELAAGRNGYRVVPTPTQRGGYIVDLRRLRDRPRWTMPSVVAHELLPGHMIQLGLEGIAAPHPLRIDYAASFVEGWGIYAETLAAADGAFADPHALLGHLHWLIFRVARALADLGMHRDGWSRDEARARLVAWQGEPAYFAPFDTEVTRIAQEPASRVGEAMAWLAIADAVGTRRGTKRIAVHQRLLAAGRMRSEAVGNIS